MNNLRILLAAVLFCASSRKRQLKASQRYTKHCQFQLSVNKSQRARCCINFPHELTCQLLTNQNKKIGRRACDKRVTTVRKVKSNFPVCKSWLNSHVRGQFEIKSLIVRLINTSSYFLCVKKFELEPTNI